MQVEESDDEDGPGDGDDDDLYAFTSIADSPSHLASSNQEGQSAEADPTGQRPPRPRQPGGFGGPTVFASMSLGMNRAVLQIHRAFQQMSMRAQQRRSLTRPS